jgi:hypothetical protein
MAFAPDNVITPTCPSSDRTVMEFDPDAESSVIARQRSGWQLKPPEAVAPDSVIVAVRLKESRRVIVLPEAVMERMAEQVPCCRCAREKFCRSSIDAEDMFTAHITFHSAHNFSQQLGLSTRHQLCRVLRREGLPQIEELCAWVKTLDLRLAAERTDCSLYSLALKQGLHPPTCYRRIKRVTGKTWRSAREDGFGMMVVGFVKRYAQIGELAGRSQKWSDRLSPVNRRCLVVPAKFRHC